MFSLDSHILVIDGFELTRVTLKISLTNMGFKRFDEADNGESGHKKIIGAYGTGQPFDLIFCDWDIPIMSGLELLQKIRLDNRFMHLPFIMISAEADRSNVIEALVAGASDYMVKPFNIDVVSKKMEAVSKKVTAKKSA